MTAMKPHRAPIGDTRRHRSVSGTSTSTGVNVHGAPSSAETEIPKNTANATPARVSRTSDRVIERFSDVIEPSISENASGARGLERDGGLGGRVRDGAQRQSGGPRGGHEDAHEDARLVERRALVEP